MVFAMFIPHHCWGCSTGTHTHIQARAHTLAPLNDPFIAHLLHKKYFMEIETNVRECGHGRSVECTTCRSSICGSQTPAFLRSVIRSHMWSVAQKYTTHTTRGAGEMFCFLLRHDQKLMPIFRCQIGERYGSFSFASNAYMLAYLAIEVSNMHVTYVCEQATGCS